MKTTTRLVTFLALLLFVWYLFADRITPYTSLLVLGSDEDPARCQVPRRFQMRDGERFFAEGRNTVDDET